MASYTQHDAQFFSRRIIVLLIAVAVQFLGFLILTAGLAQRVMNVLAPPIQTTIVQEEQKHDQPPPPPPPKMERPPVEVPPPEVTINVPVETHSTAITDVTTHHAVRPPPRVTPVHRVVRVGARLDQQHSPSPDDYYPPTSRRLSEEGTTLVHACAGPDGRTVGSPTVAKSSGSKRLDAAAVSYASHARFYPGTADGRPIQDCLNFLVKFRLTD